MIHYIFIDNTNNFIEVRDIKSNPSRLDMIQVEGKMYQIKEKIHLEDKVQLVVGEKTKK